MVHEMIDGTYRQTNLLNESAEYLAKREDLRLAEIELMYQRERVAELRRHCHRARRCRITSSWRAQRLLTEVMRRSQGCV